jgi:hypothetical protein
MSSLTAEEEEEIDSLLSEPWTENDSSESFLLILPPLAGVELFSFDRIDLKLEEEGKNEDQQNLHKNKTKHFYL